MSATFSERREIILEVLAEAGSVSVSGLAKRFGVTPVTVRTDLLALEEEGVLVRTHGGALPAFHSNILERSRRSRESKSAIAKAAAAEIQNGDTVIISAGTTTALIAKYLLGKRDIHIVTNNTLLLTYARMNPQLRVTLVGGEFRASEEGIVGPMAVAALDRFHVSKAFIGIDGASVKQGFTAHFLESADLVHKMAEQADEVVVVSDSSKFGKPGFARILSFDGVDTLITDHKISNEFKEILTGVDVQIVTA
ncbi:MAG: DeoR/GlpR transcriptional regulator [Verrucomicrobia bacterium]|nr:DeoR/GlpR transcriptional regulator [Verrucomicrobiota bacterium]